MLMLARKLRAKAQWDYVDGYYTDSDGMAKNAAKREFAQDFAELLDEAFDFNSADGMPRERRYDYKRNTYPDLDKWFDSKEETER